MAISRKLLLLIAGLVVAGAPARAAEFYTEDLRIPMAETGPQGLEAFLVRPSGAKRYPLALLSHGSPRKFEDRATMSAHKYYGIALEYARRGYAALIVMRRGYGTCPAGASTASAVAPTRPICRRLRSQWRICAPPSTRWRTGPMSRFRA